MAWWTLDEASGVLELDSPALELHVQWFGGWLLAWWCDDQGRYWGLAEVGLA